MIIDNYQIMKDEFIELLHSTKRDGVEKVIMELEELGFFDAPASSKFHLNKRGGLVEHSLNVYSTAMDIREIAIKHDETLADLMPIDSVILASLLHDVCKSDIYKPTMKRRKNSLGLWTDVPGYDLDYRNFPLGHGEKSVIMLLRTGLDLTDDEIIAIRWHMNAWDLPFQSADMMGNFNAAKKQTPLLTLVQTADAVASGIYENDFSK